MNEWMSMIMKRRLSLKIIIWGISEKEILWNEGIDYSVTRIAYYNQCGNHVCDWILDIGEDLLAKMHLVDSECHPIYIHIVA